MRVLRLTLVICMLAGFWQPPSWASLYKRIIYRIYMTFLIAMLYVFSFSQFMDIVLNVDNSDEFTDSLYMMLTVFVASYKQICIWRNRGNITTIINALRKEPFKPSGLHELIIQRRFENMVQNNTLRYLTLVGSAVISVILSSVFMDLTKGNLTYRAWLPFDYSSSAAFGIVYANQMIGMSTSALVNIACESLVCGLLLHICCQFDILEYRLTKVARDQNVLPDCVRHHNYIFKYAYMINMVFAKVIAVQFAVSMLVVCSNLYRLAMTADYLKFVPLTMYTGCMLTQIFIYCWFGNEVKLKSLRLADIIYNAEWLTLSDNCKKGLLMIMKRAMAPIEFNSAHIVTMNLESFLTVLKMSYSTFNLLHQTQE